MKRTLILMLLLALCANAQTNTLIVSDAGGGNTNALGTYVYVRTVRSEAADLDYALYCHVPDNGWGISRFYEGTQIYVSLSAGYYSAASTQSWRDVWNDMRYGSGTPQDAGAYIWTGLSGANGATGAITVK